jgi:hypothetical protein
MLLENKFEFIEQFSSNNNFDFAGIGEPIDLYNNKTNL